MPTIGEPARLPAIESTGSASLGGQSACHR
jgi:hypothetical protein